MHNNTLSDIKKSLKDIKLKKGSSCFLHTSIMQIGFIQDVSINDIPKKVFDLIFKEIGKNGTISALTPYYDYGLKNKKFDLNKSPISKQVGVMSNFINNHKNSSRSLNPLFNISSVGRKAKYITKQKTPIAFGLDSAWDQMFKLNSDIVFLGCDMTVCTFIRYIEFRFGVPYLFNKHFNKEIYFNNKVLSNYSSSTVRYPYFDVIYNTSKFQRILIEKKVMRTNKNKNLKVMAVNMKSCFDIGIEELKKNVFFFLKHKPKYKKNLNPIG